MAAKRTKRAVRNAKPTMPNCKPTGGRRMPKKSTEDDFNWGRMPHPWFKQAYDIAKRNESFTAVKVKSEEFDQWFKWFRNELGFVPQFMLHGKMRANLS